jgi:hypothetical protein
MAVILLGISGAPQSDIGEHNIFKNSEKGYMNQTKDIIRFHTIHLTPNPGFIRWIHP